MEENDLGEDMHFNKNAASQSYYKKLLDRYVSEEATEEELAVLFNAVHENRMEDVLNDHIQAEMFKSIPASYAGTTIVKRIPWARYLSVAAVFLLIMGGFWFWIQQYNQPAPAIALTKYKNDVSPGHSGAILTLSNGKQIVLDSGQNGELAIDAGIKVIRENGELKYVGENNEVVYNDIKTDKGRTWMVNLPDGSKAWLNAASTIHYPLSFIGKERVVEITGECYFEVKHDAAHPFKVKANGLEIEDIGTSFNVNAYQDEPVIKTTLVEGSVMANHVILKPGEQLSGTRVEQVDIDHETAWKNGYFSFTHVSIQEMMKQLSRWYDIDVAYKGVVPSDISFSGKIGRNLSLAQVLKNFKKMNLNISIEEDKKIIIMP